jgi:hypothetical protein
LALPLSPPAPARNRKCGNEPIFAASTPGSAECINAQYSIIGRFGEDFDKDGNFLAGGSYCAYLGHTPPESPNTNMRFVNNRFDASVHAQCGTYGPVASWSNVASNVWSNNTWSGGPRDGQAVNP